MRCHICTSESDFFATAVILNKHEVEYFKCGHCGFVQTEKPFWLDEAYASAIAEIDIGPVNRAIVMSEKTSALVLSFFNAHAKFVDYGGGYGIFVRRMRDIGLDFYYVDKYCQNQFARGFEATVGDRQEYELLTAFEVFEHLEDPVSEARTLLRYSPNIFFTTEVMPRNYPKPTEWWYYALEHGQHISFFSRKSLSILAEQLNLKLYSRGSMHLLTDKIIPARLYRLALHPRLASLIRHSLARFRGIESLLPKDFARGSGTSFER
jgi:hypothetical protein